jgi:hypothetical protein
LKRENNIICFPAPAGTRAPDPVKHCALYEEPGLSFAEHREAFKGVDFGGNPTGGRILRALYRNRIHSIEELAKTPATKLPDHRRVGQKHLNESEPPLQAMRGECRKRRQHGWEIDSRRPGRG